MKIQTWCMILLSVVASGVVSQQFNDLVCSGFVEFPNDQTLEGLDLSTLEVHLYTNDGQLVEKSLCANNGFYLLPIHDLKDFYLRVSSKDEILQFKPQQARLEFSKKTLQQAKDISEQLINFKWSGFQLTGRVKVQHEDERELSSKQLGGIALQLLNERNELIDSTTTQPDGDYAFMDIMPGTFTVRPLAGQLFNFMESEVRCSLFWKEGKKCSGELVIAGFDVRGSLHNEEEALAHFKVILEALDAHSTVPGCSTDGTLVCTATSQLDGSFAFSAVPLGRYRLQFHVQPELEAQNILEIEPNSIEMSVTGPSFFLKQQLHVKKLSLNGRVSDSKGRGIEGVNIYLDGQKQCTSDHDGQYVLTGVKTGVYTLEGQHDNLVFEPLNNLKLSLGLKIPNLVLRYLNLCGEINLNAGNSIQLGDDALFSKLKVVVYLENQLEKSEKRTTPTSAEEQYKYCFQVRPGKYLIYPVVADADNAREIEWQPKSREVELYDTPLLSVNFERKIVILGGSVQFLTNIAAHSISATKIRLHSDSQPSQILQEQDLKHSGQGYATFQFENILHGSYHVTIVNPLLCFSVNRIPLLITTTSSSSVAFQQLGYTIHYAVTQPIAVTLTPQSRPQQKELVTLDPSKSHICVLHQEDYLIVVDECLQTDLQTYRYKINDVADKFITHVQKVRVQGNIALGSLLSQLENKTKILMDLQGIIKIEVSHTLNGRTDKELIDVQYEQDKFTFTLYARQSTLLMLKPIFQKEVDAQVENLLFEPRGRQLQVDRECIKSSARFELNTGFVFHGRFEEAAIEDVLMTIYSNEQEVVEQVHVSTQTFKVGPYIDNANYTLSFEKVGYRFAQTQQKNQNVVSVVVTSERLGSMRIVIKDEGGQPLPQVMVFISTISKTNNLRISNQTNEEGVYVNTNFAQGEYMVKAFLKEYLFEPSSKMVNLLSGQHQHIDIVGRKIAFSIYGRVQDFNKDGVEHVIIEAYAANLPPNSEPKEVCVTDKDGNYRIRGLEPSKKYQLRVKYEQTGQTQSIITPSSYDLSVARADQHNKDFILFQKQKIFLVQGRLLIDDTYTKEEADLHQITSFEVYHQSNPEVALTNVRKLQFHRYYEVELTDPQDIIIRLTLEKDKERGEAFQWTKEFKHTITKQDLNQQNKILHNFELSRQQSSEQKVQKNNSVVMPLLIFLLVVLVFNFESVGELLRKYFK